MWVAILITSKKIIPAKYILSTLLFLVNIFFTTLVSAQSNDSTKITDWNFNIEANFNFTDPFFILPIITADKGHLHLEKRYNYESLKTASIWIGYNFYGGSNFNYIMTPMIGGLFGRIDGVAGGLEITLNYYEFQFFSEMEYVFDFESSENNFFYNWTDLTYSPLDWLWCGLSTQRTKVYQLNSYFQWGPFAGVGYDNFQLTGYFYNPGSDDYYFILTLAYEFILKHRL
jgi:hypothetical protein